MILLYHNVIPDSAINSYQYTSISISHSVFFNQIYWLENFFKIISIDQYLIKLSDGTLHWNEVAITFDDGTAITFKTIFPFIEKLNIPVTIFVTLDHVGEKKLIWGSYLNALCYEDNYPKLEIFERVIPLSNKNEKISARRTLEKLALEGANPVTFCEELSRKYPINDNHLQYYQGMSVDQLELAGRSQWITIGAHGVSHRDLIKLNNEQKEKEIFEPKEALSKMVTRPIDYFAYPSGSYDQKVLEFVNEAGYKAAFATIPKKIGTESKYEIARTGIYSPSIPKLLLKVFGVSGMMRSLGIKVG